MKRSTIAVGALATVPFIAIILLVLFAAFFWKGSIKPVALGGPRAVVEVDETLRDRGFIGIQYESIPEDEQAMSRLESGVIVTHVIPESPAESVGIAVGDFLVGIDGVPLESREHMKLLSENWKPGQIVKLAVVQSDADEPSDRIVECRLMTFDEIMELQLRHSDNQSEK